MDAPAPTRLSTPAVAAPGGRAAAVTPALEAALEAAVAAERPDADATLTSLHLDVAAATPHGAALTVTAWVERATRTLAFVSAEATLKADGRRLAYASAVFELRGEGAEAA